MKVIIFGATGMVGQGVLRECLGDPEIGSILTIGRTVSGVQHEKLPEIAHVFLQRAGRPNRAKLRQRPDDERPAQYAAL